MKDPNDAVNYILANAGKYAEAKSNRVFIEEYRKSKKALLMNESDAKSAVEREQYAYSHAEYIQLIEGLKVAVETEERLKWEIRAAELRIEVWRSTEATNRNQDRTMR